MLKLMIQVVTYCLALIIQGTVALVRLMSMSVPIFHPDITLDGAVAQTLIRLGMAILPSS